MEINKSRSLLFSKTKKVEKAGETYPEKRIHR